MVHQSYDKHVIALFNESRLHFTAIDRSHIKKVGYSFL